MLQQSFRDGPTTVLLMYEIFLGYLDVFEKRFTKLFGSAIKKGQWILPLLVLHRLLQRR